MRTGGDKTRERLLLEALKLFTSKQYDQVTYSDLEKATGLSRGAILYHIKNKESLFKEVVGRFVFKNNTLTSLHESQMGSLKETIDNFMDQLVYEQNHWKKDGIDNVNFALVNIQMSAYTLFPDSLQFAKEWYRKETKIWRNVIEDAITAGEIRKVDARIFAKIFENCYLGSAYSGLPQQGGYDVECVRHQLMEIYDMIRN